MPHTARRAKAETRVAKVPAFSPVANQDADVSTSSETKDGESGEKKKRKRHALRDPEPIRSYVKPMLHRGMPNDPDIRITRNAVSITTAVLENEARMLIRRGVRVANFSRTRTLGAKHLQNAVASLYLRAPDLASMLSGNGAKAANVYTASRQ